MAEFIWQTPDWSGQLRWDAEAVLSAHTSARLKQGHLLGRAQGIALDKPRQMERALVDEAVTTAAIEGEILDRASVRSSVARHLGLDHAGLPRPQRHVDGLVEVVLDATARCQQPVNAQRLMGWHAALFPTGHSGLRRITTADWRQGPEPMKVVSGALGRETVHFEAVPAERVGDEMAAFVHWLEHEPSPADGMLRAAVAHLRLLTIHPFDDGNGRITRALTELVLARDEGSPTRLWSLSAQILAERDAYYRELEAAQRGTGDITPWVTWFLSCVSRALYRAEQQLDNVLAKTEFWDRHRMHPLNGRQLKVVNRMLDAGLDGFEGGINNRKYVSLTRASRATAQRDLAQLLEWGLLVLRRGGGRSTSYQLRGFHNANESGR